MLSLLQGLEKSEPKIMTSQIVGLDGHESHDEK